MRFLFVNIILCMVSLSFGQDTLFNTLVETEQELKVRFDRFYSPSDNSDKEQLLEEILIIFESALATEGSFYHRWESLDMMGIIKSTDDRVRVFTWHRMIDNDHYEYFGFIQILRKKDKVEVFRLQDNLKEDQNSEILDQSPENWHGKLYYQITSNMYRRQTYYTILGKDFNNSRSTIKTIEVLSIKRNQPVFERDMFFDGASQSDRIVFEYSSQVAVSVRYNDQLDQIVFDHLIPLHPVYNNNYEFYGPDGSYDGLYFSDGVWILREDVDARNIY